MPVRYQDKDLEWTTIPKLDASLKMAMENLDRISYYTQDWHYALAPKYLIARPYKPNACDRKWTGDCKDTAHVAGLYGWWDAYFSEESGCGRDTPDWYPSGTQANTVEQFAKTLIHEMLHNLFGQHMHRHDVKAWPFDPALIPPLKYGADYGGDGPLGGSGASSTSRRRRR